MHENDHGDTVTAVTVAERNRELRLAWLRLEGDPSADAAAERARIGNEVVALNKGLVRAVWSKYRSLRGADSDLLAAGEAAFWEAFLTWDADGAQLATWAWRRIDGRIRRQVAADDFNGSYLDWTRRPSVQAATTKLRKQLDREPSDEELAAETGLTVDAVARTRAPRHVSVEAMVDALGPAAEEIVTAAADTGTGGHVDDVDTLKAVVAELPADQLAVLLRCKGVDGTALDGGPVASIRETASLLGYNREGMRERLAAAVDRLRR